MKSFFNSLGGWERLLVALSLIWVVVANLIYFSYLDDERINFIGLAPAELPAWQIAWREITFDIELLRPYDVTIESATLRLSTLTNEYRPIGHASFTALPVIIIWLLYFVFKWVVAGFNKNDKIHA